MSNSEYCVMCGAEIPEGIQVCPTCERNVQKTGENLRLKYSRFIKRGDVFFADLNPVVGSEAGGVRPVVVIQNDIGNRFSTTLIVALASRAKKPPLPVHVELTENTGGLSEDTTILLEQIRTIDKRRLVHYIGHLDEETMSRVDRALSCSVAIEVTVDCKGESNDEVQE